MRRLALLVLIALPSSAFAQRNLTVIPDPDPEVERKSFQVAPGFEVNLYAADPLLAKPIGINFDARGRLWVASSEVYPQIKPGQAANDKVLVLEDKDGDGKADSTRVFADGLLIPTGVEPGDGGAYVANSTEIVFLKDTDGDGKADSRRVVLSGFGTEDTHHIIHTFHWGEDGLLYFNQSIYIHSHIETPHGPSRLGGGGIWQFRPETMRLDVFARGLVNPWGYAQDAWGASFATDGAGGEGINYIVPGAYYFTAPDAVRILPGLNPGSPKHCGLELASGRHLPEDWQGNLITNDFRANRVCRFVLSDDGSGFASREKQELIKTTHGAFRPIDVKMGPDGAIYIADWYNPIIQHGEVDFRDPRRDHTRGRIWRVTAKDRPLVERPKLEGASVESLLGSLKAPEGFTRHFAKRVMKEKGAAEVAPKLAQWVKNLDPKDANFEHDRLEALWMYQTIDVPEPDLLASVLKSPDFRARAAACRVVPHWQGRISDAFGLLAPRASDEHPRVRLEAVRALADVPDVRSVEAAMTAFDRGTPDKFLEYALWLTARQLQPHWLPALQAGKLDFGGDSKKLAFVLGAAGSPAIVGPLLASLREGKIPADREDAAAGLIASLGTPKDLASAFDAALSSDLPAPRRAAIVRALASAAGARKVRPEGDLARIGTLLGPGDEAVRSAAIVAAGAWGVGALKAELLSLARNPAEPFGVRIAAFMALARLGGDDSRKALDELARSSDLREPATIALAAIDPNLGAERAVERLSDPKLPETNASVLVAGLMNQKGGSEALTRALTGKTVAPDPAKIAVRTVRSSGRSEPALLEAFTKAGGLSAEPVALTDAEMRRMVADVIAQGDASRGEAIFRAPALQCLNCHAIAGAGGQVGPGLESIGASAPIDYLIDSILQPNKAVKEGYHSLTVATDDGRILTGVKLRENDRETVLRDAEGRDLTIPAGSIEAKKEAGSLMPAGLTETLTRPELLDLVRFLSELGKVGPYSVSKARLVRRWRTDAPGSASLNVPAYSRVDGTLPAEAIGPSGRAGFSVDVSTPGTVRFRIDPAAAVAEAQIDGKSVPIGEMIDADLAPGPHAITFRLKPKTEGSGLRVELEDAPGSPARVQVTTGK